ncbi:MAG: MoaD/ThiS family protein [bacterium]|nr:MoaD/ThiS family protein [bacterium]
MATKIINGVNQLSAELAGRTVNEVRGMLTQALNISPEANPVVNGSAVDANYALADGDELEFVKASGTKG